MCSIDGFTSGAPFSLKAFAKINSDRGPDGTSFFEDENVHMAHSLLAISPNDTNQVQPLVRGSKVFTYVGEIYGIEGWDTDWLFDLIENEDWEELGQRTNGMWAWVLYDSEEKTLTFCRDHFGVKSLYYLEHKGVFYWSSTMKPLIAVLNDLDDGIYLDRNKSEHFLGMESYIRFTNIPYAKIASLPCGTIRTISLTDHQIIRNKSLFDNWDISDNYFFDYDEYKEVTSRSLKEAMAAPNVPKALGLSGGLDSTLLAYLAKDDPSLFATSVRYEYVDERLKTTVHRQFDEWSMAKETADQLGIPYKFFTYSKERPPNEEELVHRAMGATSFDIGRLGPRYANIYNAKKHGAKIFFGGDCADETLTGYSGDQQLYIDRHVSYSHTPPEGFGVQRRFMSKVIPEDFVWSSDAKSNYLFRRLLWSSEAYSAVADHIAGSLGMESRIPFCHQGFIQHAARIPVAYRLKCPVELRPGGTPLQGSWKGLIRDVYRDDLPKHVIERDNKAGFSIPWDSRNKDKNDLKQRDELNNSLTLLNYTLREDL